MFTCSIRMGPVFQALRCLPFAVGGVNRQGQDESRAFVHLAVYLDGAPVVLHVLMGDKQAQAGAVEACFYVLWKNKGRKYGRSEIAGYPFRRL